MAFIVEDGTGLVNANSLCSVEFADLYFEDRLDPTWLNSDLEEETKQKSLINATDYVMFVWETSLKYERLSLAQSLPFPRDVIGYPDLIKKVVAEYAVRDLVSPLMPDVAQDTSGKVVTSISQAFTGLGSKSTSYSEYAEAKTKQSYPKPDSMIQPLLKIKVDYLTR